MTEKRFTSKVVDWWHNVDKVRVVFDNGEWIDADNCAKLLNALHEENEQLKKLLECSREEANDYCEELMGKDEFLRLYKEKNEQLKHNNKMLSMKMSEVYTKYCLLKEFSEDTNPNDAVKKVLSELMQITKEYR